LGVKIRNVVFIRELGFEILFIYWKRS
jgi:hypothetical protein